MTGVLEIPTLHWQLYSHVRVREMRVRKGAVSALSELCSLLLLLLLLVLTVYLSSRQRES